MPDLSSAGAEAWKPHLPAAPIPEIETNPEVAKALEALGSDLDDAASKDTAGLFLQLRMDSHRIALFHLLKALSAPRVAEILDWIGRLAPTQHAAAILGDIATEVPGERLAAAARRGLFERLLAPQRLALLLELSTGARQGAAA